MQKYYKLVLMVGIFLVFSAVVIGTMTYIYVEFTLKPAVGVLGGADRSAIQFIWDEFKGLSVMVCAEFLIGVITIIASLVMRKK